MQQSTKIILGAGAVVGLIALSQRKRVAAGAAAVTEKAKEVVAKVVMKTGPIPKEAVQNFVKYGIAAILERVRGNIPWSLAAAFVTIESRGHPYIYNYYEKVDGKKKLRRGYWSPGSPLPSNSHANGLMQILTKYLKDYGLTLGEAYDAEKNAAAAFKKLNEHYTKASNAGVSGPALWAVAYFGHNQGPGALKQGLAKSTDKSSAKNIVEAGMKAIGKSGTAADALAAALKVAAYTAEWAVIENKVKSGDLSGAMLSGVVG